MNDNEPNNQENSANAALQENFENIKESGGLQTQNRRGRIYCLSIIGEIEGHNVLPPQSKTTKYEHVIPQLAAVEQDENVDGMLVILNTMGGDVEAGLAISEMIASMSKPTVSLVLGGSHSIGVPLAVSADESFIVPSATMTIHPIRMNGTVIGVSQMFDYFAKVQERILNFVTSHSSIAHEELYRLMMETDEIANDVGSILFGEEAVDKKIIGRVGGISDALEYLYQRIEATKK